MRKSRLLVRRSRLLMRRNRLLMRKSRLLVRKSRLRMRKNHLQVRRNRLRVRKNSHRVKKRLFMTNRRGHYMPTNPAQFNEFAQKIVHYVENKTFVGNNPPWKNAIPEARFDELNLSHSRFSHALETAVNTPTHANILSRQEAQAECVRVLRAFVNQFLRFPPVTNSDRAEMGIPNHDTIRTDHTVVTETVDFVIHLSVIRQLQVDFWIKGSSSKAKPAGYDGAVIIWGITDAPPQSQDDLAHHAMASRTPFTLHFDEDERGKTVHIALAWQNERGILGAWSEYKTAVIP